MQVLVTGAAGMLGRRLVADLMAAGRIRVDGADRRIDRILAVDTAVGPLAALAAAGPRAPGPRLVPLGGPLDAPETLAEVRTAAPELIVHLAAAVSAAAEADFDLGLRVNLDALRALLDTARTLPAPPVVVFASSVAVFSAVGNATLDDDAPPAPASSYGTQKLMGELLLRDASRRGFLRARSLRLPTVVVRPGLPNAAASGFASGIIREPLAGREAVLPVAEGLRLHLASPANAVAALRHAIALDQSQLGTEPTITLPGLSVTVAEMIATLGRLAGPEAVARIRRAPDPAVEAIVASWPGGIRTPRAAALGFVPDASFEAILRQHIADTAATAAA